MLLGFTHVTNSLATVTIRHLGVPQAYTNHIERRVHVGKQGWFNALLSAVRAKVESIKAQGLFVYLRLLQIKEKNRRNSRLKGETSGFLRLVAATLKTRECQRVNEFVANTSSSESKHQIGINFMSIGFQLSPLERRNIQKKTTKMQPKEL